jgi:spore germination protein YaaH
MAQGGNPGLWETALYNWKTKAWDEVKFKTGDIEIKDRDLYVNQNRQVRFRLKVNQGGFEVQGVSISTSSEGGGGQ